MLHKLVMDRLEIIKSMPEDVRSRLTSASNYEMRTVKCDNGDGSFSKRVQLCLRREDGSLSVVFEDEYAPNIIKIMQKHVVNCAALDVAE